MSDFASTTAFDAPTGFDPSSGAVKFGAENQMLAIFYRGTKRDNFASQEAGYPIEKAVDMVEIRQFGERDSTRREVTTVDQSRWPQQWAAYQQGREQVQDGTPLELLFPKNPEVVATLKANHVHTIQALAAMPDTTNFQFASEFKKRAVIFLEGIDKGKGFHVLEKKLEDAEYQNIELAERVKTLEAQISKLLEDKPIENKLKK